MSSQKAANSQTISKIFTSRKIILNLAKKRGFNTEDYENFTITEILVLHTNKQLDMLLTNNDTGKKIYYKYHISPTRTKLRGNHVSDYIEDLFSIEEILKPEDDLVIVSKDSPNDALKNLLKLEYTKYNYFVNVYNLHTYLYNILESDLVPPHEILSNEEKENTAKQYNVLNDSQWPEISRFDPVAIAIGLRPGEVVEISRSSPTALKTKYYRLCK